MSLYGFSCTALTLKRSWSSFLSVHEAWILYIYIRVRVQIANSSPFISLVQISTTATLILAKTVQIVPTE